MKNKIFLSACLTGIFILMSAMFIHAQTVIEVTDAGDNGGAGQLRAAINQANQNSGISIIRFNIPTPTTGLIDINVVGTLPLITKTTWIDGTSQSGYVKGASRIRFVGTATTGVVFDHAPSSKLLGVRVIGFVTGVTIQFSDNTEVRDCNINRCSSTTLNIYSSSYCIIKGNRINTDMSGGNLFPSPDMNLNPEEGIFISNDGITGSKYNTIGGTDCGDANIICFTKSEGIDNYPSGTLNVGNTITGNSIYMNQFQAILLRGANNGIQPPTISLPTGCVTSGTSAVPYGIVEVFSGMASGETNPWEPNPPNTPTKFRKNARTFQGTTKADANGNWSMTMGYVQFDSITATVTDPVTNGTSALATARSIQYSNIGISWSPMGGEIPICLGQEITFVTTGQNNCPNIKYLWDFGDGSPLTENPVHLFPNASTNYTVQLYTLGASKCLVPVATGFINIGPPCPPPCSNCIGSFAPEPGDYIISAWVKKEASAPTDLTYGTPQLIVSYPGSTGATPSTYTFTTATTPSQIIDGWQRIEGQFKIPSSPAVVPNLQIDLACATGAGNCLFDDIRIFPLNGSMKSYVYDPITLRLVAELDERNYATFYEYDEEGKLVRVKKETEKGIMTIKENKNNTTKR
jgi:hypothetical protein